MKSYYIYIIRHAITSGNTQARYIGHTDEPLSPEGIEQIKTMKKEYDYPVPDAVFSSPLKRCIQTAEMIYPAFEPIKMDGLIEYNFGEFEGKTAAELENHPLFADWLAGKKGVAPPFGESNDEFAERIAQTFIKIVDSMLTTGTLKCAVITHGGVMNALLSFFGLPEAPMHEWATAGGCGYVLRITPSLWSQAKKLEVVSQIPFLPGEEQETYGSGDDDFNVEDYLYD